MAMPPPLPRTFALRPSWGWGWLAPCRQHHPHPLKGMSPHPSPGQSPPPAPPHLEKDSLGVGDSTQPVVHIFVCRHAVPVCWLRGCRWCCPPPTLPAPLFPSATCYDSVHNTLSYLGLGMVRTLSSTSAKSSVAQSSMPLCGLTVVLPLVSFHHCAARSAQLNE